MKRIFPQSFYNVVTLIGAAISGISFGLIIFLTVVEYFSAQSSPYVGIITFIILPVFLIIGVVISFLGILREHRRIRLGKSHGLHLPVVDLNNPHQRAAFTMISIGALIFLVFTAFGSFKAYEYTDSDRFCGETCHSIMEPEYTAYQYSPHAKVGCVQCHIGGGAGWYVRSKISGSYQVYAALFNKYPKPIPTPIQNLRPAQETCEQCHWPQHFFSEKLHTNTYFLSDEKNSKWTLNLLMKIGGGNIEAGPTSGIHWHMNIGNKVTYACLDTQRQVIPWVQVKRYDGTVVTYKSTELPTSADTLSHAEKRQMDCIDCHNRPTHIYNPPARTVDHVLELGWIDPNLPNIKSVSVKALETAYSTKQGALDSIRLQLNEYYAQTYPALASSRKAAVDSAVIELQKIYSRNYFPEMQVSWKRFNNNIGHLYYPGCFRCHDGKHVSDDGKVLSKDCNTCHTILSQQYQNDSLRVSLAGIEYRHPADVGDAWKETNCSDCHNSQ